MIPRAEWWMAELEVSFAEHPYAQKPLLFSRRCI
ncbi:hypothetical protein LINPERPRIM_LOCUS20042 [Linum perenne]